MAHIVAQVKTQIAVKVEGQQTFAADRETLWSLLMDRATLQSIIPGCRALESMTADEYRLDADVRVGKIVEEFSGVLRLDSIVPLRSFDIHAEGRNAHGSLGCHGRVTLQDGDDGATLLAYEAAFEAGGRPATVTPRLLQTTARSLARRALEALARQVAIRTRVYTTATAATSASDSPASLYSDEIEHIVLRRRLIVVAASAAFLAFLWRALRRPPGSGRE